MEREGAIEGEVLDSAAGARGRPWSAPSGDVRSGAEDLDARLPRGGAPDRRDRQEDAHRGGDERRRGPTSRPQRRREPKMVSESSPPIRRDGPCARARPWSRSGAVTSRTCSQRQLLVERLVAVRISGMVRGRGAWRCDRCRHAVTAAAWTGTRSFEPAVVGRRSISWHRALSTRSVNGDATRHHALSNPRVPGRTVDRPGRYGAGRRRGAIPRNRVRHGRCYSPGHRIRGRTNRERGCQP